LIASSVGYIEAVLGEHFRYASSMSVLAATVLIVGALVIYFGPEAKGVSFVGGGPLTTDEFERSRLSKLLPAKDTAIVER
jgi:hypothetical protein